MPFKLGTASRKMLVGVHPDLVKVAMRAIEISPVDFRITYGVRTLAEQKILFAAGKSRTLKSRHIPETSREKKWGHAIDFVPLPVDWNNLGQFRQVAAAFKKAGKELGVAVEWGGDWSGFKDMPHIQLSWTAYP